MTTTAARHSFRAAAPAGPGPAAQVAALLQAPGAETLVVEAWVERATRTLAFASAEARLSHGGALVAAASAVFRVEGAVR